jgi:hypothetical protein
MRRILFLAAMVAICLVGGSYALQVLPCLTVVEWQTGNTDMLYRYFCSVPMNCFHYSGETYLSPVTLEISDSNMGDYFMQDYQTYLQTASSSLQRLIIIGNVDPGYIDQLKSQFSISDDGILSLNLDCISTANQIALHDWTYAQSAVLVPYSASDADEDMLVSAANGSSLASWNNVPLFLVDTSGISDYTLQTLSHLGVSAVSVVDLGGDMPAGLTQDLSNAGISVTETLASQTDITAKMRSLSGASTLCTYAVDQQQLMPAALAAAAYGGFVFCVDGHTVKTANNLMQKIVSAQSPGVQEKLPHPLKTPLFPGEQDIATVFCNWLEDIGADDPNQLENVLTFASKTDLGYTFDRAIYGDPDEPTLRGCLAGRFPLTVQENALFINHTLLYPALIFANPRPLHFTAVMVAYEAENTGGGSVGPFTDNEGEPHIVNEMFGCYDSGYDDPGVWEREEANGYQQEGHDGRDPGSGHHPFAPTVDLVGFAADMESGSNFFYESSHGSSSGASLVAIDTGFKEDVTYPNQYWPAPDGRVNYGGDITWGASAVDIYCQNLHSIISTFNACDVALGSTMEAYLRHSGIASVSSYTSVSFDGSGWYWCLFVNAIAAEDQTLGYANAYANARTSDVFPQNDPGVDASLRYVLLGDPNMHYIQSDWTCPDPADISADYGGHGPDGNVGVRLEGFKASWNGNAVVLNWSITDDEGIAGFMVYRRLASDNQPMQNDNHRPGNLSNGAEVWERVNDELITGASPYTYQDTSARPDQQYEYLLSAVFSGDRQEQLGNTSVDTVTTPTSFDLLQNFPNPFSSVTTFTLSVPAGGQEQNLELRVYDLTGRCLQTVFSGMLSAGEHQFQWNAADDLPSGIYLCSLRAGSMQKTIKMVLVR